MSPSFTAFLYPGAPEIKWTAGNGFSGSVMDAALNAALYIRPGQTHTPPAILARDVLLEYFPEAEIRDFINPPLSDLPPDAVC